MKRRKDAAAAVGGRPATHPPSLIHNHRRCGGRPKSRRKVVDPMIQAAAVFYISLDLQLECAAAVATAASGRSVERCAKVLKTAAAGSPGVQFETGIQQLSHRRNKVFRDIFSTHDAFGAAVKCLRLTDQCRPEAAVTKALCLDCRHSVIYCNDVVALLDR